MAFRTLTLLTFILLARCSDLASECTNSPPNPSASCKEDQLQCPFTLQQPTCDGTGDTTPIATSCVCSGGAWQCPSATDCTSDAAAE